MSSDTVIYESDDHIATITINRPDRRNAIDAECALALEAAWERFEAGSDRVAVVTGAGERAFSSGIDFSDPPQAFHFQPNAGVPVSKPIVAAVRGWCIGAGAVLVAQSDLCVAADDAQFVYPEARLGVTGGLITGLAARVPYKVAMEFMLLGESLPAERAYQVGMVNKVVPGEECLDAAMAYARRLAANSPTVLRELKAFVRELLPRSEPERAMLANRRIDVLRHGPDAEEGRNARLEKRPPSFGTGV